MSEDRIVETTPSDRAGRINVPVWYFVFFALTLLAALVFSAPGSGVAKDIFFSELGIFENLTGIFYLISAVYLARGAHLALLTEPTVRRIAVTSLATFVSLLLLAGELGSDIFDRLYILLFQSPDASDSLASIGFTVTVRIVAITAGLYASFGLWRFRRAVYAFMVFLKERNALVLSASFVVMITASAMTETGVVPFAERIDAWLGMTASLAWLLAVVVLADTGVRPVGRGAAPHINWKSIRGKFPGLVRFLEEE